MLPGEAWVRAVRPWVLLVNRRAGRKSLARGRDVSGIIRVLRRENVIVQVCGTRSRAEGIERGRSLAQREVVVGVLGGDGTINSVASGIVGGRAWLAPLPGGTENVLCRELGMPLDPVAATEWLTRAKPKRRDVGFLDGRLFLVMAGIGFDGAVTAGVSGSVKSLLGRAAYYLVGMKLLVRAPVTFSVVTPRWIRHGLFEAVFSIGPRYGGGLLVSPAADPRDGWLDLAAFSWRGYVARVLQLGGLVPFVARVPQLGALISFVPGLGAVRPMRSRIRRAKITSLASVPAQIDGEATVVRSGAVSIRRGAVWVLSGR